jgi:hypothetical protein
MRKTRRASEGDLIVAKHRKGPTDTIAIEFQCHFSHLTDMAARDVAVRCTGRAGGPRGRPYVLHEKLRG